MATAKCFYCKNTVNRDTDIYVRLHYGQTFRYAHKECFDKQSEQVQNKYEHDVVDPNQIVQCIYCKQLMNKSDFDCRPLNSRHSKYAHLLCIKAEEEREKTPEEDLDNYILQLFDLDYIPPLIQKQKKTLVEKEKLRYSGIKGTLRYFYEIKQNRIDREHPSLGIVPYVYDEARKYFADLQATRQLNENKDLSYLGKIVEIKIKRPKRCVVKKKIFTFLDLEEDEND